MPPSRKRYSLHDKGILKLIEKLYPTAIVASDSKTHLRSWKDSDGKRIQFRGLIGTVLHITKPKEFAAWYDSTMDKLFNEFKIERRRYIYKGSQIVMEFPGRPERALFFLNDFVRELCLVDTSILPSINVYPFTLDINALHEGHNPEDFEETPVIEREIIAAYGEDGGRMISLSDFFRVLENYYPIICVWKLSGVRRMFREEILLDGCQGPVSKAWRELLNKSGSVSILYHGDEYSPFISACDLLARWIDASLRKSGLPLHRDSMNALLYDWNGVTAETDTSHVHHFSIWNPDLSMIVPITNMKIQRFDGAFAKRPITFLVHEPDMPEFSDKKFFKNSPLYNALVRDLYVSGGSYLWFDENLHKEIVHSGSRFLIWGERGKGITSGLMKLGFEINVIKPDDLLKDSSTDDE